MNDCQKMANRIFVCLVIIVLAIFLTGCHTIRFEWFPDKKKEVAPFSKSEEEPSPTVDVLKINF